MNELAKRVQPIFPLQKSPLVQCITNEITCESMANALLYIGAKPVMADDAREFPAFFQQTDSLLLNLGHISPQRENNILEAGRYARVKKKPTVVDLVGLAASPLRQEMAEKLLAYHPNVVKGNSSEMRALCQIESHGRGVDGSSLDQSEEAIHELVEALKKLTEEYPETTFLATGAIDVVVQKEQAVLLKNGVEELDCFTGTGDIVGAIVAALLGVGLPEWEAVVGGVSYFNCCGEKAKELVPAGLANFRQAVLNQLSLLMATDWYNDVKGSWQ
ncbi:hydroxyethylthiazole kinase [Enterococcus florum]|uniref:Hydroxyethylthiazole kinase n=1 Tax=Enterococcus florum TaxID=2480627 RepID=A0A4P5P917_9ENTE|nr:hydroxyethylthiazole kinase [Enterococcus florum]GCF94380.1 hydroxyethylthiazole kinase [Enterococcus florum]